MDLNNKLDIQNSKLKDIQQEKLTLKNKSNLLGSEELDIDLLDECARKNLNIAKPKERVIINQQGE